MPHSALIYRDVPPEIAPSRATVIALHGHHGKLDDLVPLARSLGPDVRVVAPEAARSIYNFRDAIAHTWYGGWQIDKPEPASFGDSLAQIERFVYDVLDRRESGDERLPYLLGYNQGAVLALTAAEVIPDFLSGVMAVCGVLPTVRGWEPTGQLGGLPILLVHDPEDPALPLVSVEESARQLAAWDGIVTVGAVPAARRLGAPVGDVLRRWLDDRA